jgi:hypothetical protein
MHPDSHDAPESRFYLFYPVSRPPHFPSVTYARFAPCVHFGNATTARPAMLDVIALHADYASLFSNLLSFISLLTQSKKKEKKKRKGKREKSTNEFVAMI